MFANSLPLPLSLSHLNRSTFSSSPCVMIHHRSRVTAMTTTTATTNQTFAAHDFRTWVFGRLGHGTEPPSLGGKTPKASGSRTCARHSLNVDRWINVVRRSEKWCFHSLVTAKCCLKKLQVLPLRLNSSGRRNSVWIDVLPCLQCVLIV